METLLQLVASNALSAGVLALVVAAVTRLIKKPALGHALWVLVLVRLVAPPIVAVPVIPGDRYILGTGGAFPETVLVDPEPVVGEENAVRARVVSNQPAGKPSAMPFDIHGLSNFVCATWLASAMFLIGLGILRVIRFRRLLALAEPAPVELQDRAMILAQKLGLRHCPAVQLIPGRISPLLWSWFGSTKILLPAELVRNLSEKELDALVSHELAHFRRHDHWVRYLEVTAGMLFWWYPVTWWARRGIRAAEEQCCDAWVLGSLPGCARTYAESLCKTLEFIADGPAMLPATATGLGELRTLRKRLTMIIKGNTPKQLSMPSVFVLGAFAIACLLVYPTWALRPEDPASQPVRSADQPTQSSESKGFHRRANFAGF